MQHFVVVVLVLLFTSHIQGQNIDFTLRFDEISGQYQVYGKPDFSDGLFFAAGGNQISLVVPSAVVDAPLNVQTVNGGIWVDNSQVYSPTPDPAHDFHGIASNGSIISLVANQEILLFTFTLSGNPCVSQIRLFENGTDPQSNESGMSGGDFNNYFANVFDFQDYYQANYGNSIFCPEPPQIVPDSIIVPEDSLMNLCLAITDINIGDTFYSTLCAPSASNGTSTLSVSGDQLCINYVPDPGYWGFDEFCVTVCDQDSLCNSYMIPVEVIPDNCLDSDGDNICDLVDNCVNIANPLQADCDADGIGDLCEPDTDGDGVPDDCDLCIGNDATGDSDGDGVCDEIDNCIFISNPLQADCDGDGEGDLCEIDSDTDGVPDNCDLCIGNDATGDSDGDGVCDEIDNCVLTPNPDQLDCDADGIGDLCAADSDGDAIPDGCDICLGNDATGDSDNDGICDEIDNCVFISNPLQADCDGDGEGNLCEDDTDNDGIPDGCDLCFGLDSSGDTDGDLICDNIDNCIDIPNPAQADCDNDGIGDACEPDSDGDSVPDDCDICFGNDLFGDEDGDGICDDFMGCVNEAEVGNDGEECVQPYTDVNLFATILDPNANLDLYSFSWSGNNFQSSSQNPILPNIQNTDSGTYTVTVTNTVTLCESVLSTVVDVTVIPNEPQIEAMDDLVCLGNTTQLTVPTYNGTEVYYEWVGPNGTTSSGAYPDQSILEITNFSNADAGNYSVSVLVDGCSSLMSATINLGIQSSLQAPSILGDTEVCQNSVVNLMTDFLADEYIWTGPNGFTSDQQNPAVTISAASQHEGAYNLQVTLNGCTSPMSTVQVSINEFEENPILEMTQDICDGDDIILNVVESTGDSYQWIAPSATPNSSFGMLGDPDNVIWTSSPTTTISLTDHPEFYESGEWRVQAINSIGCASAPSIPQTLTIHEAPPAAIVSSEGDVCEYEPVYLHASPVPDVTYRWYDGDPAGTPAGTLVATGQDPILYNVTPGLHEYYAMALRNDCEADAYAKVDVFVKTQPVLNTISNAGPFCNGENIQLETASIPDATYQWYGPNGFSSNAQNPVITNPGTNMEGTYLLIIEVDGCTSAPLTTEVMLSPEIDVPIAINNGPVCIGSELLFSVTNPDPNLTYEWFNSIGNVSIGFGSEFEIANVTTATNGTYYVVASDGNCYSNPEQSTNAGENAYTVAIIDLADSDAAYVGEDIYACENSVEINALPTTTGTGIWSILDAGPNTTILQPGQASSLVVNLQEGMNQLVWSVTSNSCGTISNDTLTVDWSTEPTAMDDFFQTDFNEPINGFNVMENDALSTAEVVITILSDVENGSIVFDNENMMSYYPNQGFKGVETFEYRICHEHCPDMCDVAKVTIQVAGEGCEAASVMTPNDDGYNDTFIITCIFEYPGSEMSIFNRWGDEVYFNMDYQNDWNGTFNGDPLPTGTYFYNLKLNDGQDTKMSGYIYIEK